MTVTVHLFAAARDLVRSSTVTVELPAGATVAVLRAALGTKFPPLQSLVARCAVAVNQEYAEDYAIISPADELAVIPPVSGG